MTSAFDCNLLRETWMREFCEKFCEIDWFFYFLFFFWIAQSSLFTLRIWSSEFQMERHFLLLINKIANFYWKKKKKIRFEFFWRFISVMKFLFSTCFHPFFQNCFLSTTIVKNFWDFLLLSRILRVPNCESSFQSSDLLTAIIIKSQKNLISTKNRLINKITKYLCLSIQKIQFRMCSLSNAISQSLSKTLFASPLISTPSQSHNTFNPNEKKKKKHKNSIKTPSRALNVSISFDGNNFCIRKTCNYP